MTRVVLAALLAIGACSGRDAEPSGIGPYTFTHTTLADVKAGDCQPTKLEDGRTGTWCFALPPYRIGKRSADLDLYFLGTGKDARLIEILLSVRGCVEDDLEQWLRKAMGAPIETRPKRGYWKNSFMWMAALMPSDPGRCLVHVVPIDEGSEIERIKLL